VFPESESGTRLAKNLLSSGFVDLLELTEGVSMVELEVRDAWVGKSLAELNLRKKYALNVVALHMGAAIVTAIDPMMPLSKDMKLIVIADTEKLTKLK
ncbi:MAG: TrkA family potassium uptake protein, partial [Clostridia bacterium]|nr:TrkA family potassium uptake protein [Clostridia bacterium]